MVFYLKYRPQKIEDLDSEEVKERLAKVLSSKSLPHAFLFTGPKGLGKTSTARILAKSINCLTKRETFEPCNKCENCKSITAGSNLDVIEIDGASNRGIDEIRDLREKIRLSPSFSPKKIYIIDEVHMLTTEAFNALLKTLEEPPSHVAFILCTTEPQKIPGTIISRCFHVTFKRASENELLSSFKRIVRGEKLDIDKEALIDMARLSDGSFRDGAKLLEEVSTIYGNKKITGADVEKTFGTINLENSIEKIVSDLKTKNISNLLSSVSSLFESGTDMKILTQNLIEKLHKDLLITAGVETGESEFNSEDIIKLIGLLNEAYSEIKFSVLPQIPLEIAFMLWCSKEQNSNEVVIPEEKTTTNFDSIVTPTDDKILIEVIEKVNLSNRSAAGLLRGVKLENESKEKVILITSYKFHKERLDDPKVKELIEKEFENITGKKRKVEINLRG